MATGSPVIPGPPQLKGNSEEDFWAYIQWLQSFYKALVLEGGLGQMAGEFTVSGLATAAAVELQSDVIAPQIDENYQVVCSGAGFDGTPANGAFIVVSVSNKTTEGFTVTVLTAPGLGSSVTFNYVVVRAF